MTRSGVMMRSTGTSWPVTGISRPARTWSSCTVVTDTVSGPIRPAAVARANSRSANPPPLPSRAPSSLDRDAAHHHQIDRGQPGQRDPPGGAGRPADRGRLAGRLAQVAGIQGEERLRPGQPRHRHVHGLAVLQRALAHRQLRRVRIGLHGGGRLPHVRAAQPLGGRLGAGEVRDAPVRAGEPGHPRRPHRGPHLLPQGGLRGQHIGRATGITIMTRHGTSHAPILPASSWWQQRVRQSGRRPSGCYRGTIPPCRRLLTASGNNHIIVNDSSSARIS